MGLFSKKRQDITMRVYRTNQQAHIDDSDRIAEEAANPIEEIPDGMWEKCPDCASVIYADDLLNNLNVCTNCGYHFRLTARQRITYTVDEGSFEEFGQNIKGKNPLDFPDYDKKLSKIRSFTGETEAILTGQCTIGEEPCVIAAMDGFFMMGSMGAAVGEKFARAAEKAIEKKLPFIAFTVSGGARMQEGLVSLMQMSKASAVLAKLDEAKLPYIVVLTDPTTGGVTASFAMLGDITIAEPKALIGFAGRRVIEQTLKQVLPQSFQSAEFLMEKGFVDMIVERPDLKEVLHKILVMHKGGNVK
ncbi:MAG: acetyl-CoA carboxylase, carboxyltransferase subunit beta [Christensenellaceae bacterium]